MNVRTGTAFALLSFIWGSTYLFIKIGLAYWPPFLLASLRNLLACVAVVLLVMALGKPSPKSWRQWWPPLLFALFNGSAFALIFWGQQYIPSGEAAVLVGTMPLFSLFLAVVWNKERISWFQFLAVIMGILGVVFATEVYKGGWSPQNAIQLLAETAMIGAACFYAISYAINKRYFAGDIYWNTAIHLGASGVYLLCLSIFLDRPVQLASVDMTGWWALLYLAIPGSALAYWLMFYLIKHLDSVTVSYVTLINPIVAVILGVLVLSEPLTGAIILGTALVTAGAWLVSLPKER
ncbi:MAG: hypothetical protein BAA01_05910 [Bacillus thermozeamaize]|uniref:EamA domain-containing protein n=1 Tax=Bacillus thermozeamaize TaxID=230954 RepID=A0A1Y3PBF4_9BACI|nr:MAG: hypothetical protein BAA01_05910 [Bacillus thermozeamaize]